MEKPFFIITLLIICSLSMAGCSSLQPKDKADKDFSDFLRQDQHYALFSPTTVESEEKLRLFGVADYGQRISKQYALKYPIVRLIKKFVESTPDLSHTIIVQPENAKNLSLPRDYPVLFFYSDWHLIYRRIPPSFSDNQLQVGVIGKIIPLGQILIGHGPTALRTASWEGKCYYKAFEGKYISLDEWEANNGHLLYTGIEAAQNYCADKFIAEFSKKLTIRE